jgi:sugar lactone lactonase YvrE
MEFRVFKVPGQGAEDVVVGPGGEVFTGTEDGVIHRIDPANGRVEAVADTGGRPLGIELLPGGRLLVCDARRGLLAVDPATGAIEDLVGGMRFCNNAAVAGDGTIYFSDSSTVHPIDEWRAEVVEVTRTGRLLRRTPDGAVDVLEDGLAFANGVALAGDFVAVAESAVRTIVRHWLAGPRAGERDFLVEDLPGYPDNISSGSDGLIWVSIGSPRDPLVERIQRGPLWIRRGATRIPLRFQPGPKRTVRVQAYDADGRLVHDLTGDHTRFHMVTGVREHDGRVWMGSLHESAVALLTSEQRAHVLLGLDAGEQLGVGRLGLQLVGGPHAVGADLCVGAVLGGRADRRGERFELLLGLLPVGRRSAGRLGHRLGERGHALRVRLTDRLARLFVPGVDGGGGGRGGRGRVRAAGRRQHERTTDNQCPHGMTHRRPPDRALWERSQHTSSCHGRAPI